jgi:hypothetical protein
MEFRPNVCFNSHRSMNFMNWIDIGLYPDGGHQSPANKLVKNSHTEKSLQNHLDTLSRLFVLCTSIVLSFLSTAYNFIMKSMSGSLH